jgi:hypothetical protein
MASSSDFESLYKVLVLPYGSRTMDAVAEHVISLDAMRHNGGTIKDRLGGIQGLLVHGAQIIDDSAILRSWYTSSFPIVLVECAKGYAETEQWSSNKNQVARLLQAHVNTECSLQVLSRAYWQPGYQQFLDAATFLRSLVETTGTYDAQRRVEFICLSMPRRELMPVAPFSETSGQLLLPPSLKGDPTGGRYVGEWVESQRDKISVDEIERMKAEAQRVSRVSPYLVSASKAVVRIFCTHPLNHDDPLDEKCKLRMLSATGFFVSPRHILTARTVKHDRIHDTYAAKFSFTSNTRALFGMLQEDVDLFECREVPGQVEYLADSIRHIGVLLEQNKMPCGFQTAPWCDLMLLEVCQSRHYRGDSQYLLPELACPARNDPLFALHYVTRPTPEAMEDTFGSRGHNKQMDEAILSTQFWHYDLKVCSFGQCLTEDVKQSRVIKFNSSLMNGSRGAPLIRTTHVDFENDAAKRKRLGEDSGGLEYACTYAGIAVGRPVELVERERDNIISMSTSELARVDSLGVNMFNEGASCHHTCLVLLYLKFIAPVITNEDHRRHLHEFLGRYQVLVSKDMLNQCHRKMLKDADDYNEYGMDFYEHHALNSALACFREGAKMFTTASIPNLTDFETELRTALQTNVSAVVVAKREA